MKKNGMTALVTGASSGIGRALASLLAREGYALILAARRREKLDALAEEIAAEHRDRPLTVAVDLAQPDAPDRLMKAIEEKAKPIDLLVNNAGFGTHGLFWRNDLKKEMDQIQVNLVALTRLTALILPGMVERGRGGVLNVASTAAFQPGPLMAVYYATKAYVLHFSEALAEELAGTGVTVTALCPGPTRTEFHEGLGMDDTPMMRKTTTAEEVARAGIDAYRRGRRVVIPGFRNRFLAFLVRVVPRKTAARAAKKMQQKESGT